MKQNEESEEIIISGMGELHLFVYCERMKREYKVDLNVGNPTVNYRETIGKKVKFNYLHKKQSGGAGQYAKVIGYVEPAQPEDEDGATGEGDRRRLARPEQVARPESVGLGRDAVVEAPREGEQQGEGVIGDRVGGESAAVRDLDVGQVFKTLNSTATATHDEHQRQHQAEL